jgi:hypothetical protein
MGKLANQTLSALRRPAPGGDAKPEPRFPSLATPAFPPLPTGLPRSCIVELVGRRSSGRTATLLYWLACATETGETCAIIDLHNQFSPDSAARTGVDLQRLVWVRCEGKVEQALRSADLLLQAGGFGIVVLDLCEADPKALHRIPSSSWYRFQRAVENTPTTFVVCADWAQAKSCAALHLELAPREAVWVGTALFPLLQEVQTSVTVREKAAPRVYTLPIREVV